MLQAFALAHVLGQFLLVLTHLAVVLGHFAAVLTDILTS